jgi:hypothetical protein
MNLIYFIIIAIVISLFIGSITYFIIEATNIKNKDKPVIGSCSTTRFGCCPNGTTASNKDGTNCFIGGCSTTEYGCCPNGKTAKNKQGSNCKYF